MLRRTICQKNILTSHLETPKDTAIQMGYGTSETQLYHRANFTLIGCTVADIPVPGQIDRWIQRQNYLKRLSATRYTIATYQLSKVLYELASPDSSETLHVYLK